MELHPLNPCPGIQKACDKMKGQQPLADALGVSQQAVSKWVVQGFAPLDRIPAIHELTGVPKVELADPKLVAMFAE